MASGTLNDERYRNAASAIAWALRGYGEITLRKRFGLIEAEIPVMGGTAIAQERTVAKAVRKALTGRAVE